MISETGATTAASSPRDDETRGLARGAAARGQWLEDGRRPRDRRTTSTIELDLALEPLIALPPSPGNVVPVREVAGHRRRAGLRRLARSTPPTRTWPRSPPCCGAGTVHPGRRAYRDAGLAADPGHHRRSGVYRDLLAPGARMLEPVCGPASASGRRRCADRRRCAPSTATSPVAAARPRTGLPVLAPHRGRHGARRHDHRPARPRHVPALRRRPATSPAIDDRHDPARFRRTRRRASRSIAARTSCRRPRRSAPRTTSTGGC